MSAKRRVVADTVGLFDEDDTPEPRTEPGRSKAMQALVERVHGRQERRRARPKTVAESTFARSVVEVDRMIDAGNYAGATARHFVALYDRFHRDAYQVEPLELGPSERYKVMMLAAQMLKRSFDGDEQEMARYVLWIWQREVQREEWRRRNGRDGGRVTPWVLFGSRSLLTDWRLSLARRR